MREGDRAISGAKRGPRIAVDGRGAPRLLSARQSGDENTAETSNGPEISAFLRRFTFIEAAVLVVAGCGLFVFPQKMRLKRFPKSVKRFSDKKCARTNS